MFCRRFGKVPCFVAFFSHPFGVSNPNDTPSFQGTTTIGEIAASNPKKSGWEGVKRMYSLDKYENFSQELEVVLQTGALVALFGGFYGGITESIKARKRFTENNLGVKFISELDAKKLLVDTIGLNFLKGYGKYGLKIGIFVTAYMLTATSVAVYRGKSGILDFSIGGAFAGTFWQFWRGPRAAIVGCATGSVFGLFAGSVTYLILKIGGKRLEDVQEWQYNLIKERYRKYDLGIKHQFEDQLSPMNAILRERDNFLKPENSSKGS